MIKITAEKKLQKYYNLQMDNPFKIILFYQYTPIDEPVRLRDEQRAVCNRLGLKGRVITAGEGINATLEGTEENIGAYIKELKEDPRFENVHVKISDGTGAAFPKLSVKVRNEIVAYRLGEDDVKPWEMTGKYISAGELHQWIHSDKKFLIIDFRNGFEQEVGFFEGSRLTGMEHSEDLPKVLKELRDVPEEIEIVTVCTGGVRCEKASGYLIKNGFKNVYQLHGGIVTYMESYPNEDFVGALYTFDNRLVMGFNMEDPKRRIVGKCAKCAGPSENFINCADDFCHRHFIVCTGCLDGKKTILCPMGCRDYSKEHPEVIGYPF